MGFAPSKLALTSTAFQHLGRIPRQHTGEGEDVSPPLAWTNVPQGTRSFALVCHDPDAPLVKPGTYGFVHWVLYGIPASVTRLEQGERGYTAGVNDMGNRSYNGPMPPEGHGTHHYYFHVYALDAPVDAGPGLRREELLDRIDDHIIEQARMVGTFSR